MNNKFHECEDYYRTDFPCVRDDVFTAKFEELLPVYEGVARLWIGTGELPENDDAGILYAQYEDLSVVQLGPVSDYNIAVAGGYTGSPADWVNLIINGGSTLSPITTEEIDSLFP